MKITMETYGDITLLNCEGKLSVPCGTEALAAEVRKLICGCIKKVILDLTLVSEIDSSGVGMLIASQMLIGGRLALFGLNKKVYAHLATYRLLDKLNIYETRQLTLASFAQNAGPKEAIAS